MPEDDLETITVRLPDEILRILDELIDKGLFSSRSEAIRDFVREHVNAPTGGARRG
jgi:Arc/MetJ-type ribon-helix-helix transcriptional regulator